jgi:hypothetical protein
MLGLISLGDVFGGLESVISLAYTGGGEVKFGFYNEPGRFG